MEVMVDNGDGGFKAYKGNVSWISDEAEFTPKTIMTKDERANLVYAIKVNVPNDGYLGLGMYGELALSKKKVMSNQIAIKAENLVKNMIRIKRAGW
ncbi:MAG: hypothetical protein R2784_07515 [Saprospiraceae bacterium]